MKIKNKRVLYISVIIISLAVVLVYLHLRTGQVKSINAQLAELRVEKLSVSGEKSVPEKPEWLPVNAGLAAFVEELIEAARASGLRKHEVSTVKSGDLPERKNAQKGGAAESEKNLKTYSLKISIEGSYRDTVEYLREVQNLRRYKRIAELVMKPADKTLKTDLTVEIVSMDGQDAAQ